MTCSCSRSIYRSNRWNLCVSCYRQKTIDYWKNPNTCKKCNVVLYMKNESMLCSKHRHHEYLKKYTKQPHRVDKELNCRRQYKKKHRAEINLKQKERESSDVLFKLKRRLRHRLYVAMKNINKTSSTIENLGCSIEDLKQHLESRFQLGMSWDNYGEWHIDHIKPLSLFDLSKIEQVRLACHYTNLQPLWKIDNLKKSNKL